MEIPVLPHKNSSATEIFKFVHAILGYSYSTLEKEYILPAKEVAQSKENKLIFDTAKIIFMPNIFNICDICLIEFNNTKDSQLCYEICETQFKKADMHLWFDDETLIQFYADKAGNRCFRFCLKPLSKKNKYRDNYAPYRDLF